MCGGWSLAPIDQRWEALEEIEKLVRDRAKLLIQGENIALFESGKLQVVRVGRAGRAEESWWRYGAELSRRRERVQKGLRRDKIFDALFWMAIIHIPISLRSEESLLNSARKRTFGWFLRFGNVRCSRCGSSLAAIPFAVAGHIRILSNDDLTVTLPCSKCDGRPGTALTGATAVETLRRVLAWHNFTGATEDDVRRASRAIESAGSAEKLLLDTRQSSPYVESLPRPSVFALEIALNEAHERDLLEQEIRDLDAQWRRAEEIAAIVDNDLTFRLHRPS